MNFLLLSTQGETSTTCICNPPPKHVRPDIQFKLDYSLACRDGLRKVSPVTNILTVILRRQARKRRCTVSVWPGHSREEKRSLSLKVGIRGWAVKATGIFKMSVDRV